MTKDEALRLALEALENSVDLVHQDAYNAEQLYGNYLARQGKVRGLKVLADDHEKAITAIKAALEAKDGCQCPACKVVPHASDCAVHSEPAYPTGECNCGANDEPVQVSPLQFVEMAIDKEDCVGKPIIWAEWPNKENT